MDRRLHINPFINEQEEDPQGSPETAPDSPLSGEEAKLAATPSPKKSKRGVQKRVVSVPIGGVDGSRSKGEAYPPSDSWAWRKYGQKPIKGSPYPRGYYRCSSSKGCPARKQVERSRVDPTVLIVTYACDHNHPLPPTKHHHSTAPAAITATASIATPSPKFPPEEFAVFASQPDLELGGDSLLADGHFSWFSEVSPTSLAMLESPVFVGGYSAEDDVAVFAMGEEEESLFADLGELPECSLVFR
ncbi:hypothetical protein AAG906_007222 [Vitis piasezkii]